MKKSLIAVAAIGVGLYSSPVLAQKATVIELTQTPCQFLESENGVDRGFTSTGKADCDSINAKTGIKRLREAKVLDLKPGKYIFRVTNKNVSYPLGFWLRGDGLINRARLPSVSGGGLVLGSTKEYAITLKEGEYVYSCPLNPTPNYKLIVQK
jgi:hypothetical protein